MEDDGKWITWRGKHILVKNGKILKNDYELQKIIKKDVSPSERKRNIVYKENYKNVDIQILITKRGYTYKTKRLGENKFYADEGYEYNFKQEALKEARKSVDLRK